MTNTDLLLRAVRETVQSGSMVSVDLREASALTGSGLNVGGQVYFSDAFAAARLGNPLRSVARVVPAAGSAYLFAAKTGNAASSTNPWTYPVSADSGSPNVNASIWQIPTRVITAQLPIRTAVLSDVNYLSETLLGDLGEEFATIEGASMVINNDQSGSTTTATGATDGLRGLDSYPSSSSAAAYGSSGTAITNGLHTILTVSQLAAAISYEDMTALAAKLPPKYLAMPGTAWMMHPTTIAALRDLKAATGSNLSRQIVESGFDGVGPGRYMYGYPVIANSNMATIGATKNAVYLANWPSFLTIADFQTMDIQAMEQTAPGFITLFAQTRVVSGVRDPFAGVRLVGV